MNTLAEVTQQPASGLLHIDALLDAGPGWNFLAPARSTLVYSFALGGARSSDAGVNYNGALSAFNSAQQSAVVQALDRVTDVTGIRFQASADGAAADLHFASADIVGSSSMGYTSTLWNYRFDGNKLITEYTAGAWIYLDNAEWAADHAAPMPGSDGFETLLHEIGHALGLKHSFEGDVRLPVALDHTGNTLMSYTVHGGPHDTFAAFDVAALLFLYGDDGLGGGFGLGSAGHVIVGTDGADSIGGSSGADRIDGGAGSDVFEGLGGNDSIDGGSGIDRALYAGARSDYTLQRAADGSFTLQGAAGSEGSDTLVGVERLGFADRSLALDLDGAAGITALYLAAVFGSDAVADTDYAGIGLSLLDSGTTPAALMQLALDARLGAGFGHDALVELLYLNVIGEAPTVAERQFWVGALDSGQYTPVALAQMAAVLDLNAQNIDFVGLVANGLDYS